MKQGYRKKWESPLITSILSNTKSVEFRQAVNSETNQFISRYENNRGKATNFRSDFEKLADFLGIEYSAERLANGEVANLRLARPCKYIVNKRINFDHYFRQRFALAHEMGHVLARRACGPLSIANRETLSEHIIEEEIAADEFAYAILMPEDRVQPMLVNFPKDSFGVIREVSGQFLVSYSDACRRIAGLTNSIVLFFSDMENPEAPKDTKKALRTKYVYPSNDYLAKSFIPRFITAKDERFEPNIIRHCYEKDASVSGPVQIADLGDLKPDRYQVTCASFRDRKRSLFEDRSDSTFFEVACFIQRN